MKGGHCFHPDSEQVANLSSLPNRERPASGQVIKDKTDLFLLTDFQVIKDKTDAFPLTDFNAKKKVSSFMIWTITVL